MAPAGAPPLKKQAELFFPPEFADDFPVAMQISEKYGLVYVITKLGLLFVYDLQTATAVYRNRISPDPIFLTANSPTTGGFYAVNRWVISLFVLKQLPSPILPGNEPQQTLLPGMVSLQKCRVVGSAWALQRKGAMPRCSAEAAHGSRPAVLWSPDMQQARDAGASSG